MADDKDKRGLDKPRSMTLDDLKRQQQDNDDDKQRFYSGGHRSGMYVEGAGPGSGEDDLTRRAVESVFERARLPEQIDAPHLQPFQGRPHKLAEDASSRAPEDKDVVRDTKSTTRHMIFWKDGVTIENGPLRSYSSPSTKKLLDQLNSGQAPLREFGLDIGQSVDVKVAHCLEHNFSEIERHNEMEAMTVSTIVKNEQETFTGASRRLTDCALELETERGGGSACSGERLRFDRMQPSTRLQLRLSNGERVVEEVNTTVTVGQLLRHMQALNPSNYTGCLLVGAPPQPITAGHEDTLEKAGILNTIVIQK